MVGGDLHGFEVSRCCFCLVRTDSAALCLYCSAVWSLCCFVVSRLAFPVECCLRCSFDLTSRKPFVRPKAPEENPDMVEGAREAERLPGEAIEASTEATFEEVVVVYLE